MLTEKEFLSFLNDNSLDGSLKENLSKIIDLELEKSEEEMDTELIEYCLNEIKKLESSVPTDERKGDNNNIKVKTSFKLKKVVALIAIIFILLVSSISVSAMFFDINMFDGIVELYNEYIRINFDQIENKSDEYKLLDTDLARELSNNGFEKVLLPEIITDEDYTIKNIKYEKTEDVISANIKFKYKFKKGNIYVYKYSSENLVPDTEYLDVTGDVEEIQLTNVTVYCVEHSDYVSVNYRDGIYLYTIILPVEFDEAVEIAKTVR